MRCDLCRITEISDADLDRWYREMNAERKKKCNGLQQTLARKQCIAADHFIRKALEEHFGTKEFSLRISPSGKPYVEGNSIYFSYAHSDDILFYAISSRPVGADVERIRTVSGDPARKICTPGEKEFLSSAKDREEWIDRFFYLWTRKEAVFKVEGTLPRRDSGTEVLHPSDGLKIETWEQDGYVFSVAEKNV